MVIHMLIKMVTYKAKSEFWIKMILTGDKGYTRYFAHPITSESAKTQLIDIEGWHNFSISYKGDTHVLTVTYGSSQAGV